MIEVNLFHRSKTRIKNIIRFLEVNGGTNILGDKGNATIKGLEHSRAICSYEGIYSGDVILVPLEDGDRCEALKKMGKTVITIDLNALSRTARTAHVTIVDNVTRAIPNIYRHYEHMENPELSIKKWDNSNTLQTSLDFISQRLQQHYSKK